MQATSVNARNGKGGKAKKLLLLDDPKIKIALDVIKKNTPIYDLFVACQNGNIQKVDEILSSGKVDVNQKDSHGATPLFVAIVGKQKDVVRLMLRYPKLDVNAPQLQHGSYPYLLYYYGYFDLFDELVATRPELRMENAIFTAISEMNRDFFHFFTSRNLSFDVNAFDKADGKTALIKACEGCLVDLVMWLLGYPYTNTELKGPDGLTALEVAIKMDFYSVIDLFLRIRSIDVNRLYDVGGVKNTLLHIFLMKERNGMEFVDYLARVSGIDFERVNSNGSTPLNVAMMRPNQNNVKLLLCCGADPKSVQREFAIPENLRLLDQYLKNPGHCRKIWGFHREDLKIRDQETK